MFQRRELLKVTGLSTLVGITGCTQFSNSTTEISQIKVTNNQNVPNEISVLILDGESVVYWDSHKLDASDGAVQATKTIGESWKSAQNFRIYARSGNKETMVDVSEVTDDVECIKLDVKVSMEGELDIYGGNCRSNLIEK